VFDMASPEIPRPGTPAHGNSERKRKAVAMVVSTLRIVTAPKSRAEVIRTLAAQLGPMRVQPGCLRCDLYRDVEDPGTITLVEEWESQVEMDLRLRSEEYRAVLAAIELAEEQPVIHFDTVIRRAGLEIVVSARA
jgi:quinol monooxygenase YgiN